MECSHFSSAVQLTRKQVREVQPQQWNCASKCFNCTPYKIFISLIILIVSNNINNNRHIVTLLVDGFIKSK